MALKSLTLVCLKYNSLVKYLIPVRILTRNITKITRNKSLSTGNSETIYLQLCWLIVFSNLIIKSSMFLKWRQYLPNHCVSICNHPLSNLISLTTIIDISDSVTPLSRYVGVMVKKFVALLHLETEKERVFFNIYGKLCLSHSLVS